MDPATTAHLLGSGSAQAVLAICVVALALIGWVLARALMQSYRERIGEVREVLSQQSASSREIAETMRDLQRTIDLALAALRRPS